MRRLATTRPSVVAIAVVAVLSIAGSALANRSIRDNTVNTRDIKDNTVNSRDVRNGSLTTRDIRDNQVNTRDVRDGALRSPDVHDGTLQRSDLDPGTAAELGRGALFDPRAHAANVAGSVCCASWDQGPINVTEVAASAANPIPNAGSGRARRNVVLDPGTYVIQTSGYAQGGAGTEAAVTRFFLGGQPVGVGGGYVYLPIDPKGFPVAHTYATAIEVPNGTPDQRRLIQRAVSVGNAATLADNLLIWEVSGR